MKDKQAREQIKALANVLGIPRGYENGITIFSGEYRPWEDTLKDYVECSTCHCLVNKNYAKKEQKLVDKKIINSMGIPPFLDFSVDSIKIEPEKEIQTDYYCKHCQPKKGEELGQKHEQFKKFIEQISREYDEYCKLGGWEKVIGSINTKEERKKKKRRPKLDKS